MKAKTSRRSNMSSWTKSVQPGSTGCRYWAIQNRVLQVAQAALALLHIGLDQVAAGAGPRRGGSSRSFSLAATNWARRCPSPPRRGSGASVRRPGSLSPVSWRASRIEVRIVKSSRAELHALLDGPRGVADFEAQVPQGVEHVLDHALGVPAVCL